ncbi:MAG: helix-turn-helix domain-containing protein [Candidatus Dormibacteria bacterium]
MPRIRLILQEREGISLSMSRDISMRQLARQLGLDPATVSREVRAGGGRSATVPSESQRLPVGAGGGLRCESWRRGRRCGPKCVPAWPGAGHHSKWLRG